MTLNDYIARFASLRAEMHVRDGHFSPHKVCLLLAVMDMVGAGKLSRNYILLNDELKQAFTIRFQQVQVAGDRDELYKPFYYLKTVRPSFWHHKVREGKEEEYQRFKKKNSEKLARDSIEYASVDQRLFEYFKLPSARAVLTAALVDNLDDGVKDRILAPAKGWSWDECELVVADYLDMLKLELQGAGYNKAERNRALREKLGGRTKSSIERKHQNISAILMETGMPIIDGYKPLSNYQRKILPEVVGAHLAHSKEFERIVRRISSQRGVELPTGRDLLQCKVDLPVVPRQASQRDTSEGSAYRPPRVDYLEREKANTQLGARGEKFVLEYEKVRLAEENKGSLSEQVALVSEDPRLGYDIHSYEANGKDRFIEVKTTNYARYTRFFVTPNELRASEELARKYHLYRVFTFSSGPKFFSRQGNLENHFLLDPSEYTATIRRPGA